jgi:4-amino-4-deoxy-L-arabinose transferase-like glycosyltransferase
MPFNDRTCASLSAQNRMIFTLRPLKTITTDIGGRDRTPLFVIGAALLYWGFQVAWFWRYCGRNINADAISYIGIARHVQDGNFRASLHGYWSPLVSWIIAAGSFLGSDRTLDAHLLMLPAFAACLVLVYRLTYKLWGSRLLAALAVLWFTAARGIAAFSVCFIGADLILTAIVLLYFILLLGCIEHPENLKHWLLLGMAHGVAFLAKAIAMPLFAFATLLAVVATLGKTPRQAVRALAVAAIFPALLWASWGMALRAKYGVFTTGYQLHWNLVDPDLRAAQQHSPGMLALYDSRGTYDSHMVADAMPPGSPFWQVKVWRPGLIRQIVRKEIQNVPQACKEFMVLLTPGGLLALLLCIIQLTRGRLRYPAHYRFVWIVVFTTAALVGAYCMLVFDGRYVIPMTPVLIALAVRFAVPSNRIKDLPQSKPATIGTANGWQTTAGVMLLIGLIGVQLYWASPFRTVRQDFQQSVYSAAGALKNSSAETVVVIGNGPYPEHGVGWEAGIYAAYFAGAHIVGDLFDVPTGLEADSVAADVRRLNPDAVMVWGTTSDPTYSAVVDTLRKANDGMTTSIIRDPKKGEVGTVLVRRSSQN